MLDELGELVAALADAISDTVFDAASEEALESATESLIEDGIADSFADVSWEELLEGSADEGASPDLDLAVDGDEELGALPEIGTAEWREFLLSEKPAGSRSDIPGVETLAEAQDWDKSCVCASGASVARGLGIDIPESSLIKQANDLGYPDPRMEGVHPAGIESLLEEASNGTLEVERVMPGSDMATHDLIHSTLDNGGKLIIGVDNKEMLPSSLASRVVEMVKDEAFGTAEANHAVAIHHYDPISRTYTVMDPSSGRVFDMPASFLEQAWESRPQIWSVYAT